MAERLLEPIGSEAETACRRPERLCSRCGQAEPLFPSAPVWAGAPCCASCGWTPPVRDGVPHLSPEIDPDEEGGFDPRGFAQLAEAEAEHFWFAPRARLLRALLDRHFPSARSVLEIGCGTGHVLTAFVAGRRWDRAVGSELHAAGLAFARGRLPGWVELVQMDARRIPARNAFDVVGAFDVIEHIADDAEALRAMFAAVRPGGGVVVSVPQHPWLWSRADEAARHVRRYRRGELEARMREAGFRVMDSTSFAALPLPLMAASRLAARGAGRGRAGIAREREGGIGREWEMLAGLNSLLRAVLRAEVALTSAGVRWPVGGSRIVVGLKA